MRAAAPICILLLLSPLVRADEPVQVDRNPPTITRRTFDPSNRPPDMPRLEPGEAAVTNSAFSVASQFEVSILEENRLGGRTVSRVRIERVRVTLNLSITLWLPHDADRELMEHEEGHRLISEHFYRDAREIACELAARMIGQTRRGVGSTPDEARQAAIAQAIDSLSGDYMARTQRPGARVNARFDEITSHGRNQKITVRDAVRQAIEEYESQSRQVKH